jgi:hypothetical protein
MQDENAVERLHQTSFTLNGSHGGEHHPHEVRRV